MLIHRAMSACCRAAIWILSVDLHHVLLCAAVFNVLQVSILQIVDVIHVSTSDVSAAGRVCVAAWLTSDIASRLNSINSTAAMMRLSLVAATARQRRR
jgi:hypothetical protein